MIPSIYIMAAVTTLLAVGAAIPYGRWRFPKEERRFLLILLLVELPMCAIAYYGVRMPLLDAAVMLVAAKGGELHHFLSIFYAPLTEEPAKVWILLIPWFRHRITKENFWRAALALGWGFGIGELWVVANFVAENHKFDALRWYQFTGFLNERLMVCLEHGCFVALTLYFTVRGRFLLGFFLAMVMHYLGNFPIYLMQIDLAHLGEKTWGLIVGLWVPVYLVVSLILFVYLATGTRRIGQFIFGDSLCPECLVRYPSPFFGFNMFDTRYERCPHCKKWHWVSKFLKPDDVPPRAAAPSAPDPASASSDRGQGAA